METLPVPQIPAYSLLSSLYLRGKQLYEKVPSTDEVTKVYQDAKTKSPTLIVDYGFGPAEKYAGYAMGYAGKSPLLSSFVDLVKLPKVPGVDDVPLATMPVEKEFDLLLVKLSMKAQTTRAAVLENVSGAKSRYVDPLLLKMQVVKPQVAASPSSVQDPQPVAVEASGSVASTSKAPVEQFHDARDEE